MSKDIFVAASPFQLLSLIEAAKAFNDGTPQILIIMNQYQQNSVASIEKLLSFYEWSSVHKIDMKGKLRFAKQLFYILKYKTYDVRNVFIGDFKGWYFQVPFALNMKKSGKIFLVDDGAATIIIQKKYLPSRKIYEYKEAVKNDTFKKRFLHFLNLNTQLNEDIDVFSIFDLEPFKNQQVIKNSLSFLKSRIADDSQKSFQSIFIGTDLIDGGHIQEASYLNCIRNVIDDLKQPIIYYPHRNESERTLMLISEIDGVTIHKNQFFIELELIENNIQPLNIISFWSTSLFTLNMLFPEANLYFLKIAQKDFKSQYFDEINLVYEYYEKNLTLNSITI